MTRPLLDLNRPEAPAPADPTGAEHTGRFLRPRLRVYCESLWVDDGLGSRSDFREHKLPVAALSFAYEGFVVEAGDPRQRIFCGQAGQMAALLRDEAAEHRARYLLESFGAIELEALEHVVAAPGSRADYLVAIDDDEHSHCAFTAYAVPQLRALGWRVEVDDAYPYRVIERDTPWYAVLDDLDDKPDWFSLELGIELEGQRVNLLPVLLELIDSGVRFDRPYRDFKRPHFVHVPSTGRYLALPGERLKLLMQVIAELYRGEGDRAAPRIEFPGLRSAALERLEQAFAGQPGALRLSGAEHVRRPILGSPGRELPLPRSRLLQAELRPYQQAGVQWLSGLRTQAAGGVLADDMGLGKTLQTIALLCLEVESNRASQPSLIVAPTSLVGNWKRELSRFAPALRVVCLQGAGRAALRQQARDADVVVTSYPVLARDQDFFEQLHLHYLVLDEAQVIKNRRSRISSVVRALQSEHRLCLTGTPIENDLCELWSLFDFLMPDLLGSEAQFKHFFRAPIEQAADEARLQALRDQVAPFILRRMKDQVAPELPPKTELVLPVELTGKQRELYESIRVAAHAKVRSAISKHGVAASTVTILDALMRLRQLCCDPRLLRGEAARFVRESAKHEALMELLTRQLQGERRVLLFSQFTSMLALIAHGLCQRGIAHVSLTGATRDRDRAVQRFERGEVDVFLISLKAGGTGLNLVSADTVIHYDPWWNPAAQDQATDRAYRIGQTKPVFAYNLIAAGSVEERMLALQKRKRRLAESILGGDSRREATLSVADVEHLLSPLE